MAAETIVVSDTGDTLSPKAAPLIIAPITAAGFAPSTIPAGYMIAVNPSTVPIPVPKDVAKTAADIKDADRQPGALEIQFPA